MNQDDLGERLRRLRVESGLSQESLANVLGVSRSCLRNWELSERLPPADMVAEIARYFHISSDYLLGLTDLSCRYAGMTDRAISAMITCFNILIEEVNNPQKS